MCLVIALSPVLISATVLYQICLLDLHYVSNVALMLVGGYEFNIQKISIQPYRVSSRQWTDGVTVAIMQVLAFLPKDSLNNLVSLLPLVKYENEYILLPCIMNKVLSFC